MKLSGFCRLKGSANIDQRAEPATVALFSLPIGEPEENPEEGRRLARIDTKAVDSLRVICDSQLLLELHA
jgi:hypothetical protein